MARPPKNSTLAPIDASTGTRAAGSPREPRGECVEAHQFAEAALDENPPDENAPEQKNGAVPTRRSAVDQLVGAGSRGCGAHKLVFQRTWQPRGHTSLLAGGLPCERAEAARHGVDRPPARDASPASSARC